MIEREGRFKALRVNQSLIVNLALKGHQHSKIVGLPTSWNLYQVYCVNDYFDLVLESDDWPLVPIGQAVCYLQEVYIVSETDKTTTVQPIDGSPKAVHPKG